MARTTFASAVGNRTMARLARANPPSARPLLARCSCGAKTAPGGTCLDCATQHDGSPHHAARGALARAVADRRANLVPAPKRTVARLVGSAACTAGTAGASDDPAADLEDADRQAHDMAAELATDYQDDAATVATDGIPDSPSASLQAYLDHFGLPPAQGSGFLNRITGTGAATQEAAVAGELRILSRRFALIARLLSQRLRYVCGDARINLGAGCASDFCSQGDVFAFSCRGNSAIALCPIFWSGVDDNTARGAIIIHELFHVVFGLSNPRQIGEVGDERQRGPGANFNISECYESLVDDVFSTDSHTNCTPV